MTRRKTAAHNTTTAAPQSHGDVGNASAAQLPPLPRQRRRRMLVLGVAMIAAGAVVTGYLFTSASHREPVVILTRDVPIGTRLTGTDLATARVAADANVPVIPAAQERQLLGRFAATDLRKGTLLAPSEVTTALSPAPGQQVVPVAVKDSEIPARGLGPGDQVLVVPTPGDQDTTGETPGSSEPAPLSDNVPATVDRIGHADADGMRVVDLVVDAQSGPPIVRQASTGRIAFIVTSREPSQGPS